MDLIKNFIQKFQNILIEFLYRSSKIYEIDLCTHAHVIRVIYLRVYVFLLKIVTFPNEISDNLSP